MVMSSKTIQSELEFERSLLERFLTERLGGRVRHLNVIYHRAGVILQGQSDSFHSKQIAQHAVMEFTRTPILANEIEVL